MGLGLHLGLGIGIGLADAVAACAIGSDRVPGRRRLLRRGRGRSRGRAGRPLLRALAREKRAVPG